MSQNNMLKEDFEEIVRLCKEAEEEGRESESYFDEPATDEEIQEWERQTNITIPESYKEWLKLTSYCQLCQTTASFHIPNVEQPEFIPEDYVIIGQVVGDGEVVCFSKSTGEFITYFEDEVDETYEDFRAVLKEVKRKVKGESYLSEETIKAALAKLNAIKGTE